MRKFLRRVINPLGQKKPQPQLQAPASTNMARSIPDLDVGQLYSDLLQAYQNPKAGSELRKKWANQFPMHLGIQTAFRDIGDYAMDPRKHANVVQSDNPNYMHEVVASRVRMVQEQDAKIRQGLLIGARNKRMRKTGFWQLKKEGQARARNERTVKIELGRFLKTVGPELKPRVQHIQKLLFSNFQSAWIRRALVSMALEGPSPQNISEAAKASTHTLGKDELSDTAWLINSMAVEIAAREKKAIPDKEISLAFNAQYQRFLILRQKMTREEYLRQQGGQVISQKLLE
ncbi:MAG: hypothetical protein PHD95_04810 [Candidatus ainarchaeum sp.]|nr:hypothetical protein [Candidatus ainarchaeum sp.]